MSKHIGLLVNPIAGMGGSVGLKGTDGDTIEHARALGASPVTPQRTRDMLEHLAIPRELRWSAPSGSMGGDYLEALSIPYTAIDDVAEETSAEDTRRIARQLVKAGVDLLVFVGGDGTARDIVDAIGISLPVVGVPAGVKVYSAAFALSPRAAAHMIESFIEGASVTEQEVLDIDEDAFRAGRLAAQPYGFLLVPDVRGDLQPGKEGSRVTPDIEENRHDVAADIVEGMDPNTLYLLGPGTTVAAIAEALGIPKTLLGVDAILGGKLIGQDLNERAMLELLQERDPPDVCIIVTPLGGNGFIFGRGNKQFTPEVIRRVGPGNIRVVSTDHKLRELSVLRVDTGDHETDRLLEGYIQVTIGYHYSSVIRVVAA